MTEQVIISNPEDQKKVRDCLQEISNSMSRIEAERDFIKEAISALAETVEIDKKLVRKMAKVFHASTFAQTVAEAEQFEVTYQNILGVSDEQA